MKKQSCRKLSLNRETLGALTAERLRAAVGGTGPETEGPSKQYGPECISQPPNCRNSAIGSNCRCTVTTQY